MLKKLAIIIMCFLFVCCSAFTVNAESNYKEYTYNMQGQSVPTPETYKLFKILNGTEETGLKYLAPKDIVHDNDGNLYVLDNGNNRIVVYNKDLSLERVISNSVIDGETVNFTNCAGLFITDKKEIYITDPEAGKIYVVDLLGNGLRSIGFVPQPIVDSDFTYRPTRLTVDSAGIMQVQAAGCYNGLITLDADGNMIGYCGTNKIQPTAEILVAMFWRRIFSQDQQDNIKQIIPVEFSSVAMDKEGFVYTTTKSTDTSQFEIMKLNPSGDNILYYGNDSTVVLGNGDYGDLRTILDNSVDVDTQFGDLIVDEEGFIFGLDVTRGRVFQYDQKSNLVSIIGGMGEQNGTFKAPCAISAYGGKIFVLDSEKGNLTVFSPTEYVEQIRNALVLDSDSRYDEALPLWQEVYSKNCNYQLAISGIGKAAYKKGDYKTAMQYFKRAEDRTNYDLAFTNYRSDFLRNNFTLIAIVICVVAVCAIGFSIWRKRRNK